MQPQPAADERSYTIKEFCAVEQISKFTYFKMREAGLGPRELRFDVRVARAHRRPSR